MHLHTPRLPTYSPETLLSAPDKCLLAFLDAHRTREAWMPTFARDARVPHRSIALLDHRPRCDPGSELPAGPGAKRSAAVACSLVGSDSNDGADGRVLCY